MSDTENQSSPNPDSETPDELQTNAENPGPENPGADNQGEGSTEGAAVPAPLTIVHQYIKDLSFENPSTPRLQLAPGTQPSVDLNVDVTAEALDENVFEVSTHISFKTRADEHVIYLGELVYACVAHIQTDRKETIEPLLLVEAPRIMFPYVRAIISNTTRDGGFQPLLIAPFDFIGLYKRRLENRAAQAEGKPTDA